MPNHHMNRATRDLAVEQSLDAAIEIDEVIRGTRKESPHLKQLVTSLIGSNRDAGSAKKELMKNSQFSSLYHRAAMATNQDGRANQDDVLSLLLAIDGVELSQFSPDQLAVVRQFCLGLNRELVSESFSRMPEPPLARSQKLSLAYGY